MTTWEKTFGRKEKTQLAENLGPRSDIKLKTELLAEELGGLCALEEIRWLWICCLESQGIHRIADGRKLLYNSIFVSVIIRVKCNNLEGNNTGITFVIISSC